MTDKMRNLLIRAATGVVFVAVILVMMWLGKGTYLALLIFIALLCGAEFFALAKKAGLSTAQKWLGTGCILIPLAAMWFFPTLGEGMGGLADGEWDWRMAPAFVVVVWANDVFAYLVGSALGRHKMSPKISPNKSWEGFAGGIIGAMAVAVIIGHYWITGNVWLWGAFGLVVALGAVGGDLAESRLKRRAGVKDSGKMLPGHGGMLDRFDAMLGAAPAAFLFFLVTTLLTR